MSEVSSRWSHWRVGEHVGTCQALLFGRDLGDDEELCPSCRAPLGYDYYDGVIRVCERDRLYWLDGEYETGMPGHPMGPTA